MQVRQFVAEVAHVAQGDVQSEQPSTTLARKLPEAQIQVFVAVIGNTSVQVRQLVAEALHVAHGAVHFVHPPTAEDRNDPVAQVHVLVPVMGNPSMQVRHRVAELQLAQGEVHSRQAPPDIYAVLRQAKQVVAFVQLPQFARHGEHPPAAAER